MSPTLTTFLFEAANFLVLAAVLGGLFFKPVRQALADRRAQLLAGEQRAAEQLAEVREAQREITATRAGLQAELDEMRALELEAARKQADQLLSDARGAAERELQISRQQVAQISASQRDLLAEAAATVAAETVQELLRQIGGPEFHAALVQAACVQLGGLPHDALGAVKVESAQPLTPQERAAVDQALGAAASGVDYRVADDLGAGVRISTAQGLIDASASGLALFARQALVQEMRRRANNHSSRRMGEP